MGTEEAGNPSDPVPFGSRNPLSALDRRLLELLRWLPRQVRPWLPDALRPHADEDDIAQLAIIELLGTYRSDPALVHRPEEHRALLIHIARERLADELRRAQCQCRNVHREEPIIYSLDGEWVELACPRPGPEAQVLARDLLEQMAGHLTPQDGQVLRMWVAGHGQVDIATHLGVSSRTVERRWDRIIVVLEPYRPEEIKPMPPN
jgi:RNA polymerase sigma factor (sigma-70 family)